MPDVDVPVDVPVIGEYVDGIDILVVNERAVRASAGLLFLFGVIAVMTGALTGDLQLLRAFGGERHSVLQ